MSEPGERSRSANGPGDVVLGDFTATLTETDALAARFEQLASEDFAGYCPIYERIARCIADDEASLSLLFEVAPTGRTPILALAAVHDRVLSEPSSALAAVYAGRSDADPWPLFRQLLHSARADVVDRMRTHSIQTNEVGRAAALAPALCWVRRRAVAAGDVRPLALVEIGPSAGLNLLLDRFAITYERDATTVATVGDDESPVRLRCELRGPGEPPLDSPLPPIASRTGLDLSPIDVLDEDACRWLAACVWPGVPDRPERLAAAIELARTDPPTLHAGDAVTDLVPLLDGLEPDVVPVVFSTWALAYFGRDGRAALLTGLDEWAARRDLVLVTAEDPRMTPWLPELPAAIAALGDADGDGTATVLGARTWRAGVIDDAVLAVSHPHMRWMAWAPEGRES
ncbi:MAG TPA: DUF2332 domain-containing protein [Acidimicrobiales bacterium]